MCTTCGCGQATTTIDGKPIDDSEGHRHRHDDGTVHSHPHAHGEHVHRHDDGTVHSHAHGERVQAHDGGTVHAQPQPGSLLWRPKPAHAPGIAPTRAVQIEQDILAANDACARVNRRYFAERGIFALNLVSSPGSGKTTLLVRTIAALAVRLRVAVVEGDQQTSLDADRIRATGAPAVQVNTGKGCHLDAQMVARALARLDPPEASLVLIENVGNLVCPAAFDLGEAHKVVVLSVTEGDDKPLKYPDMFHAADLMLINKVDLAPHVDFDVDAAIGHARRMRPGLPALALSARTGAGFDAWIDWILRGAAEASDARSRPPRERGEAAIARFEAGGAATDGGREV